MSAGPVSGHDHLSPVTPGSGWCCHPDTARGATWIADRASVSRVDRCACAEVLENHPVDAIAQPSLECRASFLRGLALRQFLQVVVAAETSMLDLAHRHDVQHRVRPTIATRIQPLSRIVSTGGISRRGTGVAGEVTGRAEPVHIADLA